MTDTLARPRITRDEYRRLPEGPPFYELIDGELIEMTRPSEEHGDLCQLLIEMINPHIRKASGGRLSLEPNLYLPDIEEVFHPDLAFVAERDLSIRRAAGFTVFRSWCARFSLVPQSD